MKNIEMMKPKAGATQREIKLLEVTLAADLPDDFKDWLSIQNGGWPRQKNCWIEKEDIPGSPASLAVSSFFGINEILENRTQYGPRIPSDLIPIANDDIGNLVCLGIMGLTRNCVYLWDHENEPAAYQLLAQKVPPNHSNLYLVAESFGDFLALLGPSD